MNQRTAIFNLANPQGGSNQPPGQPKPNIFGQNMPNPFTSPPLNPVPLSNFAFT